MEQAKRDVKEHEKAIAKLHDRLLAASSEEETKGLRAELKKLEREKKLKLAGICMDDPLGCKQGTSSTK
jgi:hypothetical protein